MGKAQRSFTVFLMGIALVACLGMLLVESQIEQVNPGLVGVEIDHPCPSHADIVFWYASHQDRLAIEEFIGGDTFFGIPYRLQNR